MNFVIRGQKSYLMRSPNFEELPILKYRKTIVKYVLYAWKFKSTKHMMIKIPYESSFISFTFRKQKTWIIKGGVRGNLRII